MMWDSDVACLGQCLSRGTGGDATAPATAVSSVCSQEGSGHEGRACLARSHAGRMGRSGVGLGGAGHEHLALGWPCEWAQGPGQEHRVNHWKEGVVASRT